MRGPVTSVGPLAEEIVREFAISWTDYGVLTAVPIAAFGIFSLFSVGLAQRIGIKSAVAFALVVLTAGAAARMLSNWYALLAGTVALGAGIAILNVVVVVAVKAWFAERTPLVMGIYTGLIGLSGSVGGLTAVPVLEALGSVEAAFGLWAVMAGVALVVWLICARKDKDEKKSAAPTQGHTLQLMKNPTAVSIVFVMGLQSLLIYTVAAWLPSYLVAEQGIAGRDAGFWLFVYLVSGLPASIFTPALIRRLGGEFRTEMVLCAAYLFGIFGWLAGPQWMIPACVAAGASQGSMLSVAFLLMAKKCVNMRQMLSLSALSQTIGYVLAGLGPWVFGIVLESSNAWMIPMMMLAAVVVLWGAAGWCAARRATI